MAQQFEAGERILFSHPNGSCAEGYFIWRNRDRLTLKLHSGKLTTINIDRIRQNEAH